MTSIDLHAARVRALLRRWPPGGARETLMLAPAAVAADPGAYDRRVLARSVDAPLDLPRFDNADGRLRGARGGPRRGERRQPGLAARGRADPGRRPRSPARGGHRGADHDGLAAAGRGRRGRRDRDRRPAALPRPEQHRRPVAFSRPVVAAAFVRARGSNARRGRLALPAGTVLRAAPTTGCSPRSA